MTQQDGFLELEFIEIIKEFIKMLEDILRLLAGLAGLGGLISVLVNLLKAIGLVKDGTSEQWVQGFNLVAFIAVAVVYFMKVQVDWAQIDGWLEVLATFIGFVVQLFGSKVTYAVTRGAPVIGFSYSKQNS